MEFVALVLIWLGLMAAAYTFAMRQRMRRVSQRRLEEDILFEDRQAVPSADLDWGPLQRFLRLAGYLSPSAPAVFLLFAILALLAGAAAGLAFENSSLGELLLAQSANVPASFGELFQPILTVAPWIIFVILASIPWMVVRSTRARRIRTLEADLPLTLELLATMSDAGLGFDPALRQVLRARIGNRPLGMELGQFQQETMAGVPRIRALRRFSARCSVPSITSFVSSLVQAEQVGAGLTEVLRRQADDLRNRRRERAMVLAEALPVKLVFPLVICFLPAIFLVTLGPAFHQFFKLADTVIRQAG